MRVENEQGEEKSIMVKITVYKLLFILLLTLTGCGNMFSKNKTRFYWTATESAPKKYPMRIIDGTFYYHGEGGGLYIPTAASINPNWGTGRSSHVVGEDFKPLPDRVDVNFFSFTENKLYRGSFGLPYEKILSLFKEGVSRDKDLPIFGQIMVGVAPGGAVAVWVTGRETREIFFGQAEPYEAEIRNPLGGEIEDRAQYARSYLEDLPTEVLAEIDNNGVPLGLWERYRKPHRWVPVFPEKKHSDYIGVSFFNGESYRMDYPFNDTTAETARPLPWIISFRYLIAGETVPDFFDVRFDDKELYQAFKELGNNQEPVYIEIDPRLPKNQTKVRLSTDKQSIELKKYTIDM